MTWFAETIEAAMVQLSEYFVKGVYNVAANPSYYIVAKPLFLQEPCAIVEATWLGKGRHPKCYLWAVTADSQPAEKLSFAVQSSA